MWLSLIFHGAKFIIENCSDGIKLGNHFKGLEKAIMKLESSGTALLAVKSLIKGLEVISQVSMPNDFDCIESAFRSCLGGILSAISLAKDCKVRLQSADNDATVAWNEGFFEYRTFLKTILPPTSIGCTEMRRKLSYHQSGGICTVLASFCMLPEPNILEDVFDTFNLHNKNIPNDDKILLRQMAVSFSMELARIGRHHDVHSKNIVWQQLGSLLDCLIFALLDVEALIPFPTCNLSLLSELGGDYSRLKGEETLLSMHSRVCPSSNVLDRDAAVIPCQNENYFDTACGLHTSKNIWSFCQNCAFLMTELGTTHNASQITFIGNAILHACDEFVSSDKMELLRPMSVERECFKRVMVIESILSAIEVNRDLEGDTMMQQVATITDSITTKILENLFSVTEASLYHEAQSKISQGSRKSQFMIAKTCAFQKAYSELSGSLLAILLRKNLPWKNKQLLIFARDRIIVGSLTRSLDIRSAIEVEARRFDLYTRKFLSTYTISSRVVEKMNDDFRIALLRRSSELLVHDAASFSCQENTALLYSLVTAASQVNGHELNLFISTTSGRLTISPKEMLKEASVQVDSSEKLINAIDFHLMFQEENNRFHAVEKNQLASLRDWALMNLFPAKLKSPGVETRMKIVILNLISRLFEVFSSVFIDESEKIHTTSGGITSDPRTYAEIIYAIKACLQRYFTEKSEKDDRLIESVFSCSLDLFKLPVIDTSVPNNITCLLQWANRTSSSLARYIVKFWKWLGVCGKLLQDLTPLKDLSQAMEKDLDIVNSSLDMHEFKSFSVSLATIEYGLSLGKEIHTHSTNRYTKNLSREGLRRSMANHQGFHFADDLDSRVVPLSFSCKETITKFNEFTTKL